jgi:hypothetical protein
MSEISDDKGPAQETKLASEIEADIALLWADNVVAAQLTRTVARALVHNNVNIEQVREQIRSSGRVVD